MKKINIGDSVRVTANNTCLEGYSVNKAIRKGHTYKVTGLSGDRVQLGDMMSNNVNTRDVILVELNFVKGCTVKIKEDLTFKYLMDNRYFGWNDSTPKFLRNIVFAKMSAKIETYLVSAVLSYSYTKDTLKIHVKGTDYLLSAKMFEVVDLPTPAKKMTVNAISKALGYEIEVVKG